ncbi:hypothetical protein ACW95P_04275 [Candidatus Mycoplasma pogonae]
MKSSKNKNVIKKSALVVLTATPLVAGAIAFVTVSKTQQANSKQLETIITNYSDETVAPAAPVTPAPSPTAEEIAAAKQALKDKATVFTNYKSDVNYLLADDDKKQAFDNKITELTTKANETGFNWSTSSSEYTSFVSAAEATKTGLNGNANKANAIKTIKELPNLSEATQTAAETEINNTSETNTNEKLKSIVQRYQGVNSKFTPLKEKLGIYTTLMNSIDYIYATNRTENDNKVKEALNKVLDSSITYLTASTTIDAKKIKANDSNQVNVVINAIGDATNSLNGREKFKEAKDALKAKLQIEPLSFVAEAKRKNIENEITEAANPSDLETLKYKVETAEKLAQQIKAKIDELLNRKTTEVLNYNLSDDSLKSAFDNAISELKEYQKNNLFDTTIVEAAEAKLAAVNELKLNGNDNLTFYESQIENLDHLSGDQKTKAKAALRNVTKITSKLALENEGLMFIDMNANVKLTKKEINDLKHLSSLAKDKFIEKFGLIDITNLTLNQMKEKNAEIKSEAIQLNTKFNDLNTAYETYKAEMIKANYVDATETVKTSQDAAVTSALDKVLDASTKPGSTNDLQGKIKVDITIANIDAAIADINAALAALDGAANLEAAKAALKVKTNDGEKFSSFSTATKAEFHKQINDAQFIAEVNEVEAKAEKTLERFKGIFETIKKLQDIKSDLNYILADPLLMKAVNDILVNLNTFKDTNILEEASNVEFEQYKNQADTALANLNGNTNLTNAESKVKGLQHIPETERTKAVTSLPKTSLAELVQRTTDLEEVNTAIGTDKATIDTLLKLSNDFRTKLKVETAAIDVTQTKDNNIKHTNTVTQTAVALNKKYPDFQKASENYISVHQTAVYAASTNQEQQDKTVTAALNNVLSDARKDLNFNFETNTFKYGTDMAKVEQTIATTESAMNALNGEIQIQKIKTTAAEEFDSNTKYEVLPVATKTTLQSLVKSISSNRNDWKEKIEQIKEEAETVLVKVQTINSNIALAEAKGERDKVAELKQLKEVNLVDLTKFSDLLPSTPNIESSPNKMWGLLALIALIPIGIATFFVKFKQKNK